MGIFYLIPRWAEKRPYRNPSLHTLLIICYLFKAFCQDPCTNHKLIDEPHRSAAFVPKITDRLLCDRGLATGWYKFAKNENMPTSCVQKYHCGTNAPVWLNGALPSVAEGEAPRTACINYGNAALGPKCCNRKLNIKVKNCNGFYVYHLSRVPGCSIAYCAGKLFFSSKHRINVGLMRRFG